MAKPKIDKAVRARYRKDAAAAEAEHIHIYGAGVVCGTDARGHAEPNARSPLELVVDATDGFIPLWDRDVSLRWRFQERSMAVFRRPDAAKDYLRQLFGEGLMLWQDAPPVKFTEVRDRWDFEITVRPVDSCTPNGCTLAMAFFPDSGRHELVIFPEMFRQSRQEQIETMAHELGHIFGLRHFFADIRERRWRSETFGTHSPFSIMNYGANSRMTTNDIEDLKTLYRLAWDGSLTEINGTPVALQRPFSEVSGLGRPFGAAAAKRGGSCRCCR